MDSRPRPRSVNSLRERIHNRTNRCSGSLGEIAPDGGQLPRIGDDTLDVETAIDSEFFFRTEFAIDGSARDASGSITSRRNGRCKRTRGAARGSSKS